MNARVGHGRRLALLVPLVLVNTAATWGQAGWAYDHIAPPAWQTPARAALAVLFAAAVESIGVYLAWEAHDALMNDQAAGLLRAGSYAVGVLAGTLNYWHFSAGLAPTAQAVTFAALSSISPWLWAIRSRSMNRGRLAELGMVDVRGVKLSTSRKVWHPVRSLRVIRWAAWAGVTDPAAAVAGWEDARRPAGPVAAEAEALRPTILVEDEMAALPGAGDGRPPVTEPPAVAPSRTPGDSHAATNVTVTQPPAAAPRRPSDDVPDDGQPPASVTVTTPPVMASPRAAHVTVTEPSTVTPSMAADDSPDGGHEGGPDDATPRGAVTRSRVADLEARPVDAATPSGAVTATEAPTVAPPRAPDDGPGDGHDDSRGDAAPPASVADEPPPDDGHAARHNGRRATASKPAKMPSRARQTSAAKAAKVAARMPGATAAAVAAKAGVSESTARRALAAMNGSMHVAT